MMARVSKVRPDGAEFAASRCVMARSAARNGAREDTLHNDFGAATGGAPVARGLARTAAREVTRQLRPDIGVARRAARMAYRGVCDRCDGE